MFTDSYIAPPSGSRVTSNALKIAAIITMFIDHVGAALFPQYRVLRWIGRIAFPLFIFMLVEGFRYTHNRRYYFLRLCAFALISEVPFDLALKKALYYPAKNNVFCTLAIGFMVMALLNYLFEADKRTFRYPAMTYGALLGIMACIILADLLHTDYGSYGVVAIGGCFLARRFNLNRVLCLAAVVGILILQNRMECWAFAGLPLIYLYNGKLGQKNPWLQYGFYLFYPVHLMLLYIIRTVFM